MRGVSFGAVLLLALFLVSTPAGATSVKNSSVVQRFSVSLSPYNTASVPQGYIFGSGTWAGSIAAGFTRMNYTVTLSGAMPGTQYIVSVSFYNATGGAFARSYGLLTTDSQGNGVVIAKSQIFSGTVQIGLALSDKTNFSPPLQVLVSDPRIGSDAPT